MNMVTVQGLDARYGRKPVLRGLDLELQDGAVTVLLGSNGAGKSTLLRLLLGLQRPRRGAVRVFGLDPVRRSRDVLRRIGYVPDVPDAPPWLCARDLFLVLSPHYPTWNNRLASELCERLVVPLHTPLSALSRGQGMKVMLVAALAPEPELLLLDEPFAGLDPLVREQVLAVVIDSVRAGERTVLCATHELELAARIADRIAVLEGGRIVQHGTLDEVLGEPEPVQVPQRLQRVLATAAQAVLA